jgi:uncharacterized membrane-anchored protein
MTGACLQLAWRPFLDPIDAHGVWYLFLVPLALGISIAYKAVRVGDMRSYWKDVAVMTTQIILAMIALAIASYVIILVIVPRLPGAP